MGGDAFHPEFLCRVPFHFRDACERDVPACVPASIQCPGGRTKEDRVMKCCNVITALRRVSRHRGVNDRRIWLVLAMASACMLAPVTRAASPEQVRETFRQLDSDANGEISTSEFEIKKIYVFGLHDANGDNSVQRAEVDLDAQQFQTVDSDGDGQISGFEFIEAPIGQFETYDTDRNGVITLEELANAAR